MKLFSALRQSKSKTVAGALATLCLSYAPAANAGDLLYGLYNLLGHHQATTYRAEDYVRTPHRNHAPAYAAPYQMPLVTHYAPYEPYVDGGSVVSQTPIVLSSSRHGHKRGTTTTATAKHTGHYRSHGRKGHAHLVGVNRKTIVCTGYPGEPDSVSCVEKHSEFIPYNGHVRKKVGHGW